MKKQRVKNIAAPIEQPEVSEPVQVYGTSSAITGTLAYLGGSSALPSSIQIKGRHDFINLIRTGISMKSLDYLMLTTGISATEMAGIIHTSDRTLRRYHTDTLLNPEQSERAIELARLYSRGEEVFGSLHSFQEWMNSSVTSLGNKKPKELLDTSLGITMLMDELGRIEYGVFA